jgi:hypothetical protein
MGQYGYQNIQGSVVGDISGVYGSIPAGVSLGDERVHNGVYYKFVYHGATSVTLAVGNYASPVQLDGGVNTVTVSTVSDARNHLGAVVCVHAAVAPSKYFWGAFKGVVPMISSATGNIGDRYMCGAAGKITSAPSLPTELVGNVGDILCVTSGTAGNADGTYAINFK